MKPNAFTTMLALAMVVGFGSTCASAADNEPGVSGKVSRMAMGWCGECHGRDGNAVSPQFPRLAGQPAEYLVMQLKALRDRKRSNEGAQDYMWGVVHKMDDETIMGLAKYFSAQKVPAGAKVVDTGLAERGKQLFEAKPSVKGVDSCVKCHGMDAQGKDDAPRLAGQHRSYLTKQIKAIQAGKREAPEDMHAAVKSINPEDIEALAEYLQSK